MFPAAVLYVLTLYLHRSFRCTPPPSSLVSRHRGSGARVLYLLLASTAAPLSLLNYSHATRHEIIARGCRTREQMLGGNTNAREHRAAGVTTAETETQCLGGLAMLVARFLPPPSCYAPTVQTAFNQLSIAPQLCESWAVAGVLRQAPDQPKPPRHRWNSCTIAMLQFLVHLLSLVLYNRVVLEYAVLHCTVAVSYSPPLPAMSLPRCIKLLWCAPSCMYPAFTLRTLYCNWTRARGTARINYAGDRKHRMTVS